MRWLLCILLLTSCAHYKPAPMTKGQIIGEVAWQTLHVIDWGQTLDISARDDYYEHNPIMGKHPSRGTVNTYMLASALVHPIVTYVLPSEYRKWWLGGTIIGTGICVVHNRSIGLGLNF